MAPRGDGRRRGRTGERQDRWPRQYVRPVIVPTARATEGLGAATAEVFPPQSPLGGVRWSLLYATFLLYVFVITTYRLGIADIAMVAAVVALLLQRERLRLPPLLAWLGGIVVWSAVGYVQTRYPAPVWDEIVAFSKLLLVTLVAANALRSRSQIRLFIIFFVGCFALYPLRGALFNYYVYHSAVVGRAYWNFIYSNPNDLAALALLQLSMVASLLVTEPKGWVRLAALVGSGLLPLLILMTQSRGGFIALCVFTAIVLLGSWSRMRRKRLVVIALLGAIVAVSAPTGVWERVRGLRKLPDTERLDAVDREGSAQQRFEIWKVATKIISDQPVTGVGLGAYPSAHASYALGEEFEPDARGKRDAHSTLLNVTAETGLPGLLMFLGLMLATAFKAEHVRRRWRRELPRATGQLRYLELGLLAFLVAGIFGSFAHLSFLYIHLTLIWVVAEAIEQDAATAYDARRMALHARAAAPTPRFVHSARA